MKTELNTKLSLNKKTISNLEVRQLNKIKGGATFDAECPGRTRVGCPDTATQCTIK